jgi:hypothetical protein
MEDRTKLGIAAALLAVAGTLAAPSFSAALAEQLGTSAKHPKIAVVSPASNDALGTIWFDVGGTGSDISYGGPR